MPIQSRCCGDKVLAKRVPVGGLGFGCSANSSESIPEGT